MRERLTIAGKTYDLASNAYTPIAYKEAFGKDYFQDLFQMLQAKSLLKTLEDLDEGEEVKAQAVDLELLANFDMTFFHRLFWVFAKSANPRVKPFADFFRAMEAFPVEEVAPVLMAMLNQGMTTRKKSTTHGQRARKSSR